MFSEIFSEKEGYMYTALLDNGDTVYAFDSGIGVGKSGKTYRLVSHLDENEDVVVDGWAEA